MPSDKDSKRFYWLKLEKDFFKRHDIRVVESMPNGKDYILFYEQINKYFPLGVSILMCIVPIIMLKRFITYKVDAVPVEETVNENDTTMEECNEEATQN